MLRPRGCYPCCHCDNACGCRRRSATLSRGLGRSRTLRRGAGRLILLEDLCKVNVRVREGGPIRDRFPMGFGPGLARGIRLLGRARPGHGLIGLEADHARRGDFLKCVDFYLSIKVETFSRAGLWQRTSRLTFSSAGQVTEATCCRSQ